MGAPLSPVLAELIMEYLEERCFKKINFHIPFFFRYVDDIITCVPSEKNDFILKIFNCFYSKIKFTIEIEDSTGISFLDTKIKVENQKIITNWYRKPTWSGRVLYFFSHHQDSQKIAIIFNMVDKAFYLSYPRFFHDNITIIKNTLINNHYPPTFIDKYIKKRLHVLTQSSITNSNTEKKNYVVTPYIKQNVPKSKHMSKKYNLDIVFCNKNKTSLYFDKLKNKNDVNQKSNVIYEIPCNDCEKVYIGQTKRYLKKRIYEHKNNYKNTQKNSLL